MAVKFDPAKLAEPLQKVYQDVTDQVLENIARHFNTGGRDTEQLRAQLLTDLSTLTSFRLNAEKAIGELYGNHQAYKLEEL